jgi:predicted RNase H-like HicB family nuclease
MQIQNPEYRVYPSRSVPGVWIGECVSPKIFTQGRNRREALGSIKGAVSLYVKAKQQRNLMN